MFTNYFNTWERNRLKLEKTLMHMNKKSGIDTKHVKDVMQSMNKLKDHLQKTSKGKYFEVQDKLYKKNHFSKIDKKRDYEEQKSQQSQRNIPDSSQQQRTSRGEYIKLLFQNHREMIKYLQLERHYFRFIAKHTYRYDKNTNQQSDQFCFDVQLGLNNEEWSCDNEVILYYALIRDLSQAILELQKNKIFHADIKVRNIILVNYPKKLCDIRDHELKKTVRDLRFKLIDFGHAFIMQKRQNFHTEKIINARMNEDINDGFTSYVSDHNSNRLKALNNLWNDDNAYKQKHSTCMQNIIKQLVLNMKEELKTSQFQKIKQEIVNLIRERKYLQLADFAEQRINETIKRLIDIQMQTQGIKQSNRKYQKVVQSPINQINKLFQQQNMSIQ